jgi:hypothetical protein
MPPEYYDKLFANSPTVAPFGAESAPWPAAYLAKFERERLTEAARVAGGATPSDLKEPKALRDWLGTIWDAVSRELDRTDLARDERDELSRLENELAHSVHVLRPVVGY